MYSQEGPGDRLNILSAVYLIILSGNKLYGIVLYNNSSYCEKFKAIFFTDILIVDKTRPRKDLIFFHVWISVEIAFFRTCR